MLMQSERMSLRFNYRATTGPLSLHQLPAGADTHSSDPVWLLYCAEPRGDAFLSPPLSNDHTKIFLRTRRRCCVLLCGLLMQRGRVSSATSASPCRLGTHCSCRSHPDRLTRCPGVGMPRQGGSAPNRKERVTGFKLQLLFLRIKYNVGSEFTKITSCRTYRRSFWMYFLIVFLSNNKRDNEQTHYK